MLGRSDSVRNSGIGLNRILELPIDRRLRQTGLPKNYATPTPKVRTLEVRLSTIKRSHVTGYTA
jgi:hypothetical protein